MAITRKGVFTVIDHEVCKNKDLNLAEAFIISTIQGYSDNEKECYLSNYQFSELLKVSENRVSHLLSSLCKRGYISIKKERNYRYLYVCDYESIVKNDNDVVKNNNSDVKNNNDVVKNNNSSVVRNNNSDVKNNNSDVKNNNSSENTTLYNIKSNIYTKNNLCISKSETETKTESNETTISQNEILEQYKRQRANGEPKDVNEVIEYAIELNRPEDDAIFFYDFYSGQGWKKSNSMPITDWKAVFRTFKNNNYNNKPIGNNNGINQQPKSEYQRKSEFDVMPILDYIANAEFPEYE